jgi:hypothetical protein
MPVWGRLFEADNGAFHKLEKARVSLGRRGGDADILIDATPNRCGDFITSAKHFELHYRGDKFLIVDTSTNGTFVNIDENNSDPTNEANVPNPRLERDKVSVSVHPVCVRAACGCASVCVCAALVCTRNVCAAH